MDDHRFDAIARTLATRDTRRGMLKGMLGGTLGATLGMLGRSGGGAQPADKVGICHVDEDGISRYIEVSANAIPAHERHGDIIAPDFLSDPANCGDCGIICPTPDNGVAVCVEGACDIACNDGYGPDGADGCVSLCDAGTTPCGNACCGADQTCVASGHCQEAPPACNADLTLCGDECIDLTSDANNCGACGDTCIAPERGSVACVDSACQVTCNVGLRYSNGGCYLAGGDECTTEDGASNHCEFCEKGYKFYWSSGYECN